MTKRRAKIAAGATVVGLTALGGVALGTNHGMQAPLAGAASPGHPGAIVTSASGSTGAQTALAAESNPTSKPIVTRVSGSAAGAVAELDD